MKSVKAIELDQRMDKKDPKRLRSKTSSEIEGKLLDKILQLVFIELKLKIVKMAMLSQLVNLLGLREEELMRLRDALPASSIAD